MSKRRVVVTGLGIVSPLGSTVETVWASVLAGRSGIVPISTFDASMFNTRFAGAVQGFEVADYLSAKEARRMDPFMHYGMGAGVQAMTDSGLDLPRTNLERCGAVMGSGIGGLAGIEAEVTTWNATRNPKKISPFYIPSTIINMVSGHLSIRYGLKGPNLAIVTACTTSTHAVGVAHRCIQYGDADVMIAGGSEMASTPTALGGFSQARALSERNDAPTEASRPWDKDRDGFVMGEGAGVVVLEEYEHAKARGARIYCELAGFGMSADANHITAPCDDGEGAARCMGNALRNAQLNPEDVQYVNAHGTSTPLGDKAETVAVKRAFGAHASKLVVSSTKSMTGHLLGAAGGVEALFSALAIYHQISPPTINLFNPGEGCDLDYCANEARQLKIDVAISNSFGFGGTNATVVLKRI